MDFMADQLVGGRRIPLLTIVDVFTRECLAIEVAPRLRSADVVQALAKLAAARGSPARIYCDNGSTHRIVQWQPSGRVPKRSFRAFRLLVTQNDLTESAE
jgi:transposase InsO family protein